MFLFYIRILDASEVEGIAFAQTQEDLSEGKFAASKRLIEFTLGRSKGPWDFLSYSLQLPA